MEEELSTVNFEPRLFKLECSLLLAVLLPITSFF